MQVQQESDTGGPSVQPVQDGARRAPVPSAKSGDVPERELVTAQDLPHPPPIRPSGRLVANLATPRGQRLGTGPRAAPRTAQGSGRGETQQRLRRSPTCRVERRDELPRSRRGSDPQEEIGVCAGGPGPAAPPRVPPPAPLVRVRAMQIHLGAERLGRGAAKRHWEPSPGPVRTQEREQAGVLDRTGVSPAGAYARNCVRVERPVTNPGHRVGAALPRSRGLLAKLRHQRVPEGPLVGLEETRRPAHAVRRLACSSPCSATASATAAEVQRAGLREELEERHVVTVPPTHSRCAHAPPCVEIDEERERNMHRPPFSASAGDKGRIGLTTWVRFVPLHWLTNRC